jgi:hypothetical protein
MSYPPSDPHHGGPTFPGVSPGYQLHGFDQPARPSPAGPPAQAEPPAVARPVRKVRAWIRSTRRVILRLLALTFVAALGLSSVGYALAPAGAHGIADIIGAWLIVAMCLIAAALCLRSLVRLRRR